MTFSDTNIRQLANKICINAKSYDLANALLETISVYKKSWAIVGGAPRGWAIKEQIKPNDIDITVRADRYLIDEILDHLINDFTNLNILQTKLGGYRLIDEEINIDIWSARETVGIAKGRFKDDNLYRAVSKSAALSLNSLVYTSRGTIYETGFFKTLRTGILRLNHSDIERAENIAYKAIRLCDEYDLIPDIPLQSLIISKTGINYNNLFKDIRNSVIK